jgi:asparagine synthase (glutamine-hydrolysing)
MSVVYIGSRSKDNDFETIFQQNEIMVSFFNTNSFGQVSRSANKISYYSLKPVLKGESYKYLDSSLGLGLEEVIKESSNNFSGIEIKLIKDDIAVTISSDRMGRGRIFVLKSNDGIYLSEDIRELFPFSKRVISREGIYSVLKFGDTPELITCIDDIQAVPVGSYWKGTYEKILNEELNVKDFNIYQKFNYSFSGGNIENTRDKLDDIFSFLAKQDVMIPISGGIDSSLINYMINDHKTERYPAYYLRFGDNDNEIEFAKKAAENTKADLRIYEMKSSDFIEAFNYQVDMAQQPIGESSTIALSFFFKQCEIDNHIVLDGTLADGCYGSVNYSKEFPVYAKKSNLRSRLEEQIASFMQLNRLPGGYKFFPRDSYVSDEFIQQLNIYIGPLGNTLFKDAKKMNKVLENYFSYYYNLIDNKGIEVDDWMKYSVFKMANYASKNNTAKTFDNVGHRNEAAYPFMWKEVLEDQGKYSWDEKSKEGIIKHPLKKVIEKYVNNDFIYRKKVGLNSSFEDWICTQENKKFLEDIILTKQGVAEVMMGKSESKKIINHFMSSESVHPNVSRLVLNIAIIQSWVNKHKLTID